MRSGGRTPFVRAGVAMLALIAPLGAATSASAASPVVTIAQANPNTGSNCYPFGQGSGWTPYTGFIYKNVPPFELRASYYRPASSKPAGYSDQSVWLGLTREAARAGM